MKVSLRNALLGAIAFQGLVLVGIVGHAALPLWSGQEVRVETLPVDPRSLFRGNYARLGYDFSRVNWPDPAERSQLRQGEVVYVSLEQGDDGLYRYRGVALDKPKLGVFLRGRVRNTDDPLRVDFGIEAFFAPKEQALALERQLRNGAVAVLKVSDSGRARLVQIEQK